LGLPPSTLEPSLQNGERAIPIPPTFRFNPQPFRYQLSTALEAREGRSAVEPLERGGLGGEWPHGE
jgi:hypothetical protein